MSQYKILKDFKGSPDGGRTVDFQKGDIVPEGPDLTPSLIETALAEKWISEHKEKKAPEAKKASK